MAGEGGVVNRGFKLGVKKTPEAVAFTDIPDIEEVDGGGGSREDVETTVWSSDGKTYRPGLYDGGEATVDFLYDPTNEEHEFIRTSLESDDVLPWELKVGTLGAFTFSGYVKSFNPGYGKRGDTMKGSFTIKISGLVVWVPAGSGSG